MAKTFHFTLFLLSFIIGCGVLNPLAMPASQNDAAAQKKAIQLLQSAAHEFALGHNKLAEQQCRELLDSPDLLKHVDARKIRLMLASLLKNQEQYQEAYDILVEMLKKQRQELSDDHPDIQDTIDAFGALVINLTWTEAIDPDLPKEDYKEPAALAKEAGSMNLPHAHWSLALLQHQLGQHEASLENMSRSVRNKRGLWLGQFSILAMALAKNDKPGLARDAYIVVCDRGAKSPKLLTPIQQVHDQAGELLDLNPEDVLKELSREDLVRVYSRLIEAYPGVARLHAWRASHLQCLGRFEEALTDLQKATEISPKNWRFAEAFTVLRIFLADEDNQAKICKDIMKAALVDMQYGQQGGGGGGMDLVLLCSLPSAANIDRTKILERAEEILKEVPSRPFIELCHGMALYRLGRYNQTIEVIPGAEAKLTAGKDHGLSIIFRGMAFQKLGEKRAAKSALKSGEKYFDSLFEKQDIVRMSYQDAGTHLCILTMTLREAKKLIQSDSK